MKLIKNAFPKLLALLMICLLSVPSIAWAENNRNYGNYNNYGKGTPDNINTIQEQQNNVDRANQANWKEYQELMRQHRLAVKKGRREVEKGYEACKEQHDGHVAELNDTNSEAHSVYTLQPGKSWKGDNSSWNNPGELEPYPPLWGGVKNLDADILRLKKQSDYDRELSSMASQFPGTNSPYASFEIFIEEIRTFSYAKKVDPDKAKEVVMAHRDNSSGAAFDSLTKRKEKGLFRQSNDTIRMTITADGIRHSDSSDLNFDLINGDNGDEMGKYVRLSAGGLGMEALKKNARRVQKLVDASVSCLKRVKEMKEEVDELEKNPPDAPEELKNQVDPQFDDPAGGGGGGGAGDGAGAGGDGAGGGLGDGDLAGGNSGKGFQPPQSPKDVDVSSLAGASKGKPYKPTSFTPPNVQSYNIPNNVFAKKASLGPFSPNSSNRNPANIGKKSTLQRLEEFSNYSGQGGTAAPPGYPGYSGGGASRVGSKFTGSPKAEGTQYPSRSGKIPVIEGEYIDGGPGNANDLSASLVSTGAKGSPISRLNKYRNQILPIGKAVAKEARGVFGSLLLGNLCKDPGQRRRVGICQGRTKRNK